MKIKGKNPETGDDVQIEAENVDDAFISSMSIFEMTDAQIRRLIENLNVSADSKQLLYSMSMMTWGK